MHVGWCAEHAWEIWLLLRDDLQHLPQFVPINGGNEDAELALLIKGHVPVSAGRTRVGANLNALCHIMQLSTQLVELLSIDAIPLFLLHVHVLSRLVLGTQSNAARTCLSRQWYLASTQLCRAKFKAPV